MLPFLTSNVAADARRDACAKTAHRYNSATSTCTRLLLAGLAAFTCLLTGAALAQDDGFTPPPNPADYPLDALPTYDPKLMEVEFLFEKTTYMVGEPIYWEIRFHTEEVLSELVLIPTYEGDVYLEVLTPNATPFRYRGTALPGLQTSQAHTMVPGEYRYFHMRVYFHNTGFGGGASPLLFPEPTQALLRPAVRYALKGSRQMYAPPAAKPIEIVAPTGRNAECLTLLLDGDLVRYIHDMSVPPEHFVRMEGILNLYRDTVYAPHMAVALANGYYEAALLAEEPANMRYFKQALAAFTVLLQVESVPYIRELALFMIPVCHYRMNNNEAFVGWYQKYLDTYGIKGRFAFSTHQFAVAFQELRPADYGSLWYLYP